MNLSLPVSLIIAHFFGDWFFQFDWMALNKGKDWKALFAHVGVWSLFLLPWGWKFALLNFAFHIIIDQTTSQWTTKLWFSQDHGEDPASGLRLTEWKMGKRHWFFVVIGFDQLVHYGVLAWTLKLLGS
jgi:hypothetical protein